jgi:hypothetical protein
MASVTDYKKKDEELMRLILGSGDIKDSIKKYIRSTDSCNNHSLDLYVDRLEQKNDPEKFVQYWSTNKFQNVSPILASKQLAVLTELFLKDEQYIFIQALHRIRR